MWTTPTTSTTPPPSSLRAAHRGRLCTGTASIPVSGAPYAWPSTSGMPRCQLIPPAGRRTLARPEMSHTLSTHPMLHDRDLQPATPADDPPLPPCPRHGDTTQDGPALQGWSPDHHPTRPHLPDRTTGSIVTQKQKSLSSPCSSH